MSDAPVVLVVEDEPSVQHTLCTALTLMGFRTRQADNVDAALTVLANEPIEAVSLDIRIPDPKGLRRSGLSVLAHLRSMDEYASVPVLVFTGMPLSDDDAEFVGRHNARVFHKPQRYSVVIEELRRLLEKTPAA
jgi:two-component system phosphate regulon response regulator PhoB